LFAAALVATLAAVSAPAPSVHWEADVLERHAPILLYDGEENWRAVAVGRFVESDLRPAEAEAPTPPDAVDVVYGRVARDGGRRWLQYWLFFEYNGQDRGIARTGRHEGDWELFQIGLDGGGRADVATLSQHSSSAACRWGELEHEEGRPRIYVANASHALYPRRGVHDRPFPDPNDEARGGRSGVIADVQRISDGGPAWVHLDARWGGSGGGIVPGEQPSPRGPAFSGERWVRPAEAHAAARGCFTAPSGAWWVVPALIGACVVAGCFALVRWRRNRGAREPGVTLGS
jgi:hypothetical protein